MKTLKQDEVYAYDYKSMHDVAQRLPKHIDEICNRRRLPSALAYCTAGEHEMNCALRQVSY